MPGRHRAIRAISIVFLVLCFPLVALAQPWHCTRAYKPGGCAQFSRDDCGKYMYPGGGGSGGCACSVPATSYDTFVPCYWNERDNACLADFRVEPWTGSCPLTPADLSKPDACVSATIRQHADSPEMARTGTLWSDGQYSARAQPAAANPDHAAGKAYCAARNRPWFRFTAQGGPPGSGEHALDVTCCPRPAPGDADYNANMVRLIDAAVDDHTLMLQVEAAVTVDDLVNVARKNGYFLTREDVLSVSRPETVGPGTAFETAPAPAASRVMRTQAIGPPAGPSAGTRHMRDQTIERLCVKRHCVGYSLLSQCYCDEYRESSDGRALSPPPSCKAITPYNRLPAAQKAVIDGFIAEDYPMPHDLDPIKRRTFHTQDVHYLPSHFDLRNVSGKNYLGPTRTQSPCGTCMSMAVAGAIEGSFKLYRLKPDADIQVSPAWLHAKIAGMPCRQGNILTIVNRNRAADSQRIERLQKPQAMILAAHYATYGNAILSRSPDVPELAAYSMSESCFPYGSYRTAVHAQGDDPQANAGAACPTDDRAMRTGIGLPQIEWAEEYQKIHISQRGPMVARLRINKAFLSWQADPARDHSDASCVFDTLGHESEADYQSLSVSHAVLVVGWGQTPAGLKYWIIRDSRGEHGICDGGFCRVAFGAMGIDDEMVGVELLDRWRDASGPHLFTTRDHHAGDGDDHIIDLDHPHHDELRRRQ